MNPVDDSTPQADPMTDTQEALRAERRAALAKLGQLTTWTAPAMLTLLVSRRAAADLGSPINPPGGEG